MNGHSQNQPRDLRQRLAENFNMAYLVGRSAATMVTPLTRTGFGRFGLGRYAIGALIGMVAIASYGRDTWVWWYLLLWLVGLAQQRFSTATSMAVVHSNYGGCPMLQKITKGSEGKAKNMEAAFVLFTAFVVAGPSPTMAMVLSLSVAGMVMTRAMEKMAMSNRVARARDAEIEYGAFQQYRNGRNDW